ncbi:MAG: carbamate kinase [Deltaproteobacteria bacterium]|nr:carbamate kinase [Deltaproteobacteria bacterium]
MDGKKGRALIAIGGNSLIADQNRQSVADQYVSALKTCKKIAAVIQDGWQVVITHGNGPQVGFMLLRSELSRHAIHEVPLVSCVADTQGALGFHIQLALRNVLKERGADGEVVTVVTQCVVDGEDPSFETPVKPIGLFYSQSDARLKVRELGWVMMEDARRGYRRVVPSPRPLEIVELESIRALMERGITVITAGGGGIPVVRDPDGILLGVDAVVDKDSSSVLLARALGIELLIVSTGVPGVYLDFGGPDQKMIRRATVDEMRRYAAQGHFARGSMAPKVDAVIDFLSAGGREAVITSPEHLSEALEGRAGTHVTP